MLADANEENFTVTVEVKIKPEGAKRPKLVETAARIWGDFLENEGKL